MLRPAPIRGSRREALPHTCRLQSDRNQCRARLSRMRFLARSLPILLTGLLVVPTALSQQLPLPNIIYPDPPPSDDQGAPKPGMAMTGTGFFVASDGSLLTAAHVVSECRQTRIAS